MYVPFQAYEHSTQHPCLLQEFVDSRLLDKAAVGTLDQLGFGFVRPPFAFRMNWIYSAVYLLPQPSAMFEGMETAARRSFDGNPNFSAVGA